MTDPEDSTKNESSVANANSSRSSTSEINSGDTASRSFWSLVRSDKSVIALIIVNFIPVLGGLLLQWDIRGILIVYWAENLVVGFYNVLKMAKTKSLLGTSKLFVIPFFTVHFGMFCLVHGVFIMVFLASGFFVEGIGQDFDLMDRAFDWGPLFPIGLFVNAFQFVWTTFGWSVLVPVLGLFISHGISFKQNFLDKKEYSKTTTEQQMFKPYGRIVIMHVSIIFAALPVFLLGSPMPLLILLIVAKTLVDVYFHVASHNGGFMKILALRSKHMQEILTRLQNQDEN